MQLNTILFGPPGTGKTFATLGLALSLFREVNGEDKTLAETTNYARGILAGEYAPTPAEGGWTDWVKRFDKLSAAGRIEFTTFHQNYAYEDFVEGIRAEAIPRQDDQPQAVAYSTQPGIFKRIAYRALYAWLVGAPCPFGTNSPANESDGRAKTEGEAFDQVKNWLEAGAIPPGTQNNPADAQAPPYVLIVDEINRGNIARILGELITLLEDSKRARHQVALGHQPLRATLPYTREPFIVPPNLYILGTMNTADRSLVGLDVALRRRFSFVLLQPRPEALGEDINGVNLRSFLMTINKRIEDKLDADHLIGHALFVAVKDLDGLAIAMRQKVVPQLREYFHDRPQDLLYVLAPASGGTCQFIDSVGEGRTLRLGDINATALRSPDTYKNLYAPT